MNNTQQKIHDNFVAAGLDPAFGLAICEHESGFNPDARSRPEAADEKYGGAWGLAQILLTTAKDLGYEGDGPGLLDPDTNIRLFIALTRRNIKEWHTSEIHDLICMHNCGRPRYKHVEPTVSVYLPAVYKLYSKWKHQLSEMLWP